MNNSIKKIYAALEIGDNELKLLVGEYFNSRFNILKSAKAETMAFDGFTIKDKALLVNEIKQLVEETSKKLGAKIEKAILVLPAYNFKRFPLRSSVLPIDGIVKKADIARAVTNSLKTEVDFDSLVVNAVINKYTMNGISTRRLPEKEACENLLVDIDLLCCDKLLAYDYVEAVEMAGIQVLDICLNSYAIAKEASLIEESLKKNIIILDINIQETFLALLSKGRLVSTEVIFEGLNQIINSVTSTYKVSFNDATRLVKYATDYNSEFGDDIVYSDPEQSSNEAITTNSLSNLVANPIEKLVEKLLTMCKPIIDQGDTQIVITGDGQDMKALVEKFKSMSNVDIKTYFPDTIGVRDSEFTSLFGSFIVFKDKAYLNDLNVCCIDLLEYDKDIDKKKFNNDDDDTITTKIKNLFAQYIN